jgi:hypothetical protein
MRRAAFAISASIAFGRFMRLSVAVTLITLLAIIPVVGCGGNTGGGVQTLTPQTITFATPATQTVGTPLTLSATASSGLAVGYDSTTTPVCTVSGSVATFVAAGTCSITASQPGNSTYAAATPVSVSFSVEAAPLLSQTITFATPASQTVGTPLTLSASASSGLAVSYESTTTSVCTVASSTATFVAAGTCSITASQPGNSTYAAATPVSVSFSVVVAAPVLSDFAPRYVTSDPSNGTQFIPFTVQCAGCEANDVLHSVTVPFNDLVLPSAETTLSFNAGWGEGNFEPIWQTIEIKRPNGPTSNQVSTATLGLGNQSTLAASATTGTLFQVEQATGQVYTLKTDGTTGTFFSQTQTVTPVQIAVDDVTGNVAYLVTGTVASPSICDQSGNWLCNVNSSMGSISSISAKGGYVVITDSVDPTNNVGIAKMDCSGYHTITVAGQPWAVAMANGTELDAYVLSRDKWSTNGLPGLTKISIPAGTVLGSVELTGTTPVSTVRATNAYVGLYQVQAFSNSAVAAVLFMSDSTNGSVLTVNTSTSGGSSMQITHTVGVAELPIAIAAQETASSSTLWVAYVSSDSGEAVTHIGAINPASGSFATNVGSCTTGVLAGGFIATSKGVYCAQGNTIQPPLDLQP